MNERDGTTNMKNPESEKRKWKRDAKKVKQNTSGI